MIRYVELLLLPPGGLFVLAAAGLLLLRTRRRRLGTVLVTLAVGLLYCLATPLAMVPLIAPLDRYPPLDPSSVPSEGRQAIAILSAGVRSGAREYGRDVPSQAAMERLRYGAWLHRRLSVPILVTGRTGQVMARTLEDELGVTPRWVEDRSTNTHQHVEHSAALLAEAGVERLYVVTHYWHMPRAMAAFRKLGLEVVPAPMGFARIAPDPFSPRWLMPTSGALHASATALHEWVGRVWYRARYGD